VYTSVFENIQECVKKPRQSKKYYGGIDVGFKNDYTVLTIINEFGELVEYLRFNDCSMTEGAKKINNGHWQEQTFNQRWKKGWQKESVC